MNSLTWERWYPFALAVLAAGLGAASDPDRLAFPPPLLGSTASLGALAFGFVGVFLAVLADRDASAAGTILLAPPRRRAHAKLVPVTKAISH